MNQVIDRSESMEAETAPKLIGIGGGKARLSADTKEAARKLDWGNRRMQRIGKEISHDTEVSPLGNLGEFVTVRGMNEAVFA